MAANVDETDHLTALPPDTLRRILSACAVEGSCPAATLAALDSTCRCLHNTLQEEDGTLPAYTTTARIQSLPSQRFIKALKTQTLAFAGIAKAVPGAWWIRCSELLLSSISSVRPPSST